MTLLQAMGFFRSNKAQASKVTTSTPVSSTRPAAQAEKEEPMRLRGGCCSARGFEDDLDYSSRRRRRRRNNNGVFAALAASAS
ncbi:hypothetical protein IAU60_003362 [Kwoniella sp. DSM 27419]